MGILQNFYQHCSNKRNV